jgi:hypothetical protein
MTEKIYKRYMVFESFDYEACGGIWDCRKDFSKKSDAIEYAEKSTYDDIHVFDRTQGKIIYERDKK